MWYVNEINFNNFRLIFQHDKTNVFSIFFPIFYSTLIKYLTHVAGLLDFEWTSLNSAQFGPGCLLMEMHCTPVSVGIFSLFESVLGQPQCGLGLISLVIFCSESYPGSLFIFFLTLLFFERPVWIHMPHFHNYFILVIPCLIVIR